MDKKEIEGIEAKCNHFNCMKELKGRFVLPQGSLGKHRLKKTWNRERARRYNFWFDYERKVKDIFQRIYKQQKVAKEMGLKYLPLDDSIFRKDKNLILKYIHNNEPSTSPYGKYGDACYLYNVNFHQYMKHIAKPIVENHMRHASK